MLVSDALYSLAPAMDEWLAALRRQLRTRGEGAPPDVLGPRSALRELETVCASMLEGRGGPNKGNRPSLQRDLLRAFDWLGSEAQAACAPQLKDFRYVLGDLPRRLETPQGARVVGLTTGRLREHLRRPEVRTAAWRDALATFRDLSASSEVCQLRLVQLAELCEEADHDWSELARRIEDLAGDDVREAVRLGELDPEDVGPSMETAGLPEERRLELCARVLAEPAPREERNVWLAFKNAKLLKHWLDLGSVQFFNAELWPEELGPNGRLATYGDFEPLPEAQDMDEARHVFDHLPEGDKVLARVKVRAGSLAQAREKARSVVRALVDIAKTDSEWVLLEGELSWRPGGGWALSSFQDPAELAEAMRARHPFFEGTAERLSDFRPEVVDRLVEGDAALRNAIEDALWTVAVERAPTPEQQTMLGIRGLERTLSVAVGKDESWVDATRRFLRAPWVRNALYTELFEAAHYAVYGLPGRGGPFAGSENADLFREVQEAVWVRREKGIAYLSLRGLTEVADRLLDVLPDGSFEHRLARDATRVLQRPDAARKRIAELEDRFESLLVRAERQRNAVVHGTRTESAVIRTVERFLRTLGRFAAQEAMRTAETSSEKLVELERSRIRFLEDCARLEAGETPVDFLFPDP